MDSQYFFNKIDELRKAKGLSSNKLCKEANVAHNALYAWKKRKTMPSIEVLESICDVLNISLAQLFGDELIEDLTEEQKKLIEYWITLTNKQKKTILELIKTFRNPL